jgi:hypothetical protein
MKFTIGHILSVVCDRMFVSEKELKKFLDYVCGQKLSTVHLAAASDYAKIPLFEQFPWVDKINTRSLDSTIARIHSEAPRADLELDTAPKAYNPSVAAQIVANATASSNREALCAARDKWLAGVAKKVRGNTFEVKTATEMGYRKFDKGYFTRWWMKQRAKP